jgi:hypothetical protein
MLELLIFWVCYYSLIQVLTWLAEREIENPTGGAFVSWLAKKHEENESRSFSKLLRLIKKI